MLAKDLIDRLERLGLLDQEIIEALREQLAQSGARVTPEAVAKLLVDNGQLTRFQATKLIGELRNSDYPDAADPAPGNQPAGDLELLDGDEEIDSADEVVEEAVEVYEDPRAASPTAGTGYRNPASAEEFAEAVEVESFSSPNYVKPKKVTKGFKPKDPTRSVWDSFKIYGISSIILVLVFLGSGLYYLHNRGNADTVIEDANKLYTQQSYAAAQKAFESFLAKFGETNAHSSTARTRVAMCELYQFAQYSDPTRVVTEAERILPRIENEASLDEERGNLAALLVDVADNIAKAAGNAKETPEKQKLLGELDRQIKLTDNPSYLTTTARQSLSARLLGVAETRARVQRDINRNLRLDEAVASMEIDLKEQKTKEVYDTRIKLLRDYPELRPNPRLVTLIESASAIQQQLVKPATERPVVTTDALPTDSVRSIALTNRSGEAAPSLRDEVVYIRVHGAILALSAAEGKLLWRRYVGYGQDHAPTPINPGGQEGVLLSDSQSLEVQRTESKAGAILWRSKIGEPFSQPIAHDRDIYLSTQSGRLISLDSDTGEPRWVTQMPQPLEESPGINDRPGKLYLTGDHSNLYVLDKRSGKCSESFYIGHAKGTCAVPPIALQGNDGGHVFVIENAGVDFALMHVLKCDKEGGALKVAQPPFRLDGNVTVSPVLVLGRRLIVLTDRGQIEVYDIEQTAKIAEQVRSVAKQVASYDTPTSAQMAVGKNEMWVTGTRIRRFELQVTTGRVISDWSNNEGDTFIGTPVLLENTLIHSRVLRGTSNARITAADPRSGKPYWQTDVGVPISLLTTKPDGKGLHAITSQAALFELDQQSLIDGATSGPIENPGGTGIAMRFENPLWIDNQRAVMVNGESSGQICVYDPTRVNQKLRLITLALPAGRPGGRGLIAGDGLLLPLDSGRIVLMGVQTGGPLASPFQPPSVPGVTVRWSDPALLSSDASQVVIADDRKKLYRIKVTEQIRELASVDLPEPLLGPMAAIGDTLIASISGPAADVLVCFDGASLEQSAREQLDGRITWGPYSAGELVLLQTDDGMLRGFDAAAKPKLSPIQLPSGKPIPGVKLIGDKFLLTGRTGWLVTIDKNSGKMVGKSDLKQPLSAQPLEFGKRLFVPGTEGLVYITAIPDAVVAP